MSGELYVWIVIAGLTVITVFSRSAFLVLGDHVRLPEAVRRALKYAPAVALTAIVVPELAPWKLETGPVFDLKLPAALLALLILWKTRSAVACIVGGMLCLWGLRWLVG